LDDTERSPVEYGEAGNAITWDRHGETKIIEGYVPLNELGLARSEQLLSFFLDGSRRVYKIKLTTWGSRNRAIARRSTQSSQDR
jgi:hypothetical protein